MQDSPDGTTPDGDEDVRVYLTSENCHVSHSDRRPRLFRIRGRCVRRSGGSTTSQSFIGPVGVQEQATMQARSAKDNGQNLSEGPGWRSRLARPPGLFRGP